MSNNNIQSASSISNKNQVITAGAFIHHNFNGTEKIFLAKRAASKKFLPNVFEIPGGHIEFCEDIELGLKREIKEELESEISIGDPFYIFTYLNKQNNSHYIEVIYFARFISPLEKIKLHPEDHSQYIWLEKSEINKIISNNKNEDDPEIKAILKGFSLLKSKKMNFA